MLSIRVTPASLHTAAIRVASLGAVGFLESGDPVSTSRLSPPGITNSVD